MCGIAGIWWNKVEERQANCIKTMTDAIAHRGPDAEGHHRFQNGLDLGHRRLAILDLDPRSNQPFHWLNRYALTFNGEIYNYLELQQELRIKGYFFQTESDTEVICAAYNEWGTDCLKKFDGMFAFVLYDSRTETLFCARDRFGEKPFYFMQDEEGFFFASEMKAFWSIGKKKKMREEMAFQFLQNDLVEDVKNPMGTFYQDIFKLPASHFALLKKGEKLVPQRYYEVITSTRYKGTFEQAVETFRYLFNQSVERRMRAHVPFGSSLSGGMDSSAVTAVMNQHLTPTATFSARFPDFEKDEGEFIDVMSEQLQTKQFNCSPDVTQLKKELDRLIVHQEEPFQTGSIFAQYEVYKLARSKKHLVLLDGQGADELLGGYFNYMLPYFYELRGRKRRAFQQEMKAKQGITLETSFAQMMQFKYPKVFEQLYRFKQLGRKDVPTGVGTKLAQYNKGFIPFFTKSNLKESLKHSLTSQGLEKLLRFSDRNAMAHSVEVRLPFLSHELVDFVMALPSDFFFKAGWTKSILRHAMRNELPTEINWRKDKVGFEAPHQKWTRANEIAEDITKARTQLLNVNWITEEYKEDWKVLILAKCTEDER